MNVFGKQCPKPRSIQEVEKLKEAMRRELLAMPPDRAQALASSVGNKPLRLAVSRNLK